MSQGLETKSADKQPSHTVAPKLDPAIAHAREAERTRKRQELVLQRERILSERTNSPIRRTALANALADIEEKLSELGWTVHL
jgi:ribosomal protein L28